MSERRKHPRYQIDGACIIQNKNSVGTIVDLSEGGISCMCLDQGKCSEGLMTQINIFCRKHDICAEDLYMRVISTEKMRGKFVDELGMRKCRAKFRDLDEAQLTQLTNIIENSKPK